MSLSGITLLLRFIFIIVANALLVIYLVIDGLSAFDVLIIAALESVLMTVMFCVARAVRQTAARPPGKVEPTSEDAILQMLKDSSLAVFVFGGTMALFLFLTWLMARPDEPVAFANPRFGEALRWILLANLGQLIGQLVDAMRGLPKDTAHLQVAMLLHLLIGTLFATFGSAFVLLMGLPALTLIALVAAKTAADLTAEWTAAKID